MSIRSLTVLLFAALAFPANAAAADTNDNERWDAIDDASVLAARSWRLFDVSLSRMQIVAWTLDSGDEDEKKLATAIRKALKLASDREVDELFKALIRALRIKHAHRNLDVLDAALRDSRKLSTDLKALRLAAEKCRPSRIDMPALCRKLAAARAMLSQDDGKIDKELKAYVAKLPNEVRPTRDLPELLDRVLAGQSGKGKSARGGGGEGKGGQGASASQHKAGEKGAGYAKQLPNRGSHFRSKAKDHAILEALIGSLNAYRTVLWQMAKEMKGKPRAACEDLAKQLAAVVKSTDWQVGLHVSVETLTDAEEALAEVDRLVKWVREDLIKKQSKD
jgi:hypothetical protein